MFLPFFHQYLWISFQELKWIGWMNTVEPQTIKVTRQAPDLPGSDEAMAFNSMAFFFGELKGVQRRFPGLKL